MTPEAVMRAWFDELWTRGEEATIDRFMTEETIVHGLAADADPQMRGAAAFKPFYRRFRGAFPDLRIEVLRVVSEGDMVAVQCRVTGTHSGPTLGPATGRHVDFTGMTMARVRDARIVEGWNSFDFMTLYQQLGLLPALPV